MTNWMSNVQAQTTTVEKIEDIKFSPSNMTERMVITDYRPSKIGEAILKAILCGDDIWVEEKHKDGYAVANPVKEVVLKVKQ